MFKRKGLTYQVFLINIVFFWSLSNIFAITTMPNVSREMHKPQFWLDKISGSHEIIMDASQIKEVNLKIQAYLPEIVIPLEKLPRTINQAQLIKLIKSYQIPEKKRFIKNQKVAEIYYRKIIRLMNLEGIKKENELQYGITIKPTNIRRFPSTDLVAYRMNDTAFDSFQETNLNIAEPLVILHQSKDLRWSFIQTTNYRGWVLSSDLVIIEERKIWSEFVNPKKFLIVTGKKLNLEFNPIAPEISELELPMGTRLPLVTNLSQKTIVDNKAIIANYLVKIPVKDNFGNFKIKVALIPISEDVQQGYLPYTRANIVKQIFKTLGYRYGWKGINKGRDSSGVICDIFKTFGFMLPRKIEEQVKIAHNLQFLTKLNIAQKFDIIDNLMPGSLLYMKGHGAIYLGRHQGRYFVLHSVHSYGDIDNKNANGTLKPLLLNQVVISDINLPRRNGQTLIESLTLALRLEL